MRKITIRLTDELNDQLSAYIDTHSLDLSTAIRELIQAGLAAQASYYEHADPSAERILEMAGPLVKDEPTAPYADHVAQAQYAAPMAPALLRQREDSYQYGLQCNTCHAWMINDVCPNREDARHRLSGKPWYGVAMPMDPRTR